MRLNFLGTGSVRGAPVFGCHCRACQRARADSKFNRSPCSAILESGNVSILIDGGQPHLKTRLSPGQLAAICVTHFHMDHVQGLFELRWGLGKKIPVYCPPDEVGCDDLFKHPGILDFRPQPEPFVAFHVGPVKITPLPLSHSKLTYGYAFECRHQKLAYLTDTYGLPGETQHFLKHWGEFQMVLDCTWPPMGATPLNHNDLDQALSIVSAVQPRKTYLTHMDHTFDEWLLNKRPSPLPGNIQLACDGQVVTIREPLSEDSWYPV